ncbi:MAG TPA: hypothetical protein VFM76_00055 [Methylophaga sp.]|nr:hypothetical protein [Methylophaga sp.]
MNKILSGMLTGSGLLLALPVLAQPPLGLGQPDNTQCETISALTGDYYHHKQSGKTKQEVQQTLRPDFMNDEFIRTVDLAINLAYTFPDGLQESDVEARVFAGCEKHQQ